jgi:hypothetical protein
MEDGEKDAMLLPALLALSNIPQRETATLAL